MRKLLQLAIVLGMAPVVSGIANAASELIEAPAITLETGWERMSLPATKFGFLVGPSANVPSNLYYGVYSKMTNHNGVFDGTRVDAAFEGLRLNSDRMPVAIGFKGFYAGHQSIQASRCIPGDPPYCSIVPLFDPSTTTLNNFTGGSGEQVQFDTNRRASHWGVAAEFKTPVSSITSLRPSEQPIALKLGLAYRRIDQSMEMNAVGDGSIQANCSQCRYLTYTEGLNTSYLGGYVGLTARKMIANGILVSMDGEIGLYSANSRYNGNYATSGWVMNGWQGALMNQTLALTRNQTAVIAALKIGADKNFGPFNVGVFARGEYYSYAPAMAYNDTDLGMYQAGLGGIIGSNNGTSIAGGSAWTYSLGGRINMPLGGPPPR